LYPAVKLFLPNVKREVGKEVETGILKIVVTPQCQKMSNEKRGNSPRSPNLRTPKTEKM